MTTTMSLTAVILTYNEEKHLARCLDSLRRVADRVYVVDSGSSDSTIAIAQTAGAKVLDHDWVNHAVQFNWALGQLPDDTDWVIRLDADEVVTDELAQQIRSRLEKVSAGVAGIIVHRRMSFMGRTIRHGGVSRVGVLRIFRHGQGRSENRWMDEHIVVDGDTEVWSGEILDDNLNSLTWWVGKHNAYASREVVDILDLEYGFLKRSSVAAARPAGSAGGRRQLKESVYLRLPIGLRAFAYFLYRYLFRLGFLDGPEGTVFHVLQGFWYRYLVDAKLLEVKKEMARHRVDATTAIERVLGIRVG
jgi:glycosyltransferase involved in cell wall biosynthesis